MSTEALKLALEVMQINLNLLEKINPYKGQEDLLSDSLDLTHKAITAIKQALAAPVQSCYCPNCEALSKELAAFKAQPAQHEPDPCTGCKKGHVCRTPECGRLKLPIDHPARTVIHPAHGITKGQP
jgi:hypothetical protein